MLCQFTLAVDLPGNAFDFVIQALFDSLGRLREEDAAKLVSVSRNWFSTEFKRKTGRTYRSRQVWVRVTIGAVWLLEAPWLRISEISNALGYSDPLKFSVAFKKEFGISPSSFRKQYAFSANTVTDGMIFLKSRYNTPPAPSEKMTPVRRAS